MTNIYDMVSCTECGAVLDKDYLKDYKHTSSYGCTETHFTCPVCKKKNEIFRWLNDWPIS